MTRMYVLTQPRLQRPTIDSGFLELPSYRSIKSVKAAKITRLNRTQDEPATVVTVDAGRWPMDIQVPDSWLQKHEPQVGGYFVVYQDGYCSYSPSGPFEKGHIRIDSPAVETDRSNHAMLKCEIEKVAKMLTGQHADTLPSSKTVQTLLMSAIAMYGEPGPQTGVCDRVRASSMVEILQKSGFIPNDKLVFDSLVSVKSAGADPFTTVHVVPETNVDNEFYNWAASHKLVRQGYKPHATVMQAYDELLEKCEELQKRLFGRPTTWAEQCVLAERERQIKNEGYTEQQDDQYKFGELLGAAECYLQYDALSLSHESVPATWPWAPEAWKPKDYRRNLVRAAALILAEMDRVDRKNAGKVG